MLIFLLILSWFLLSLVSFPLWCFTSEHIILCKLFQQCAQDNMKHSVRSWAPRVQLKVCGWVCLNQTAVQAEVKCYFSRWGAEQTNWRSNTEPPVRYITENLYVTGDAWMFTTADPHPRKWNNSSQQSDHNWDRTEKAEFVFFSSCFNF